jgi:hypothetical protein
MRKALLGGGLVAVLAVLGIGGVAGATTVPVPGVGSVEADSSGSQSVIGASVDSAGTAGLVLEQGNGVAACAGVVSPDVPSGSAQACAFDTTNPLGQGVQGVIVNNAGNSVDVFLNPPEAAVCSASSGCTGLSGGGLGGLGNLP